MTTRSEYQTAYRTAIARLNHWLANDHLHSESPFVDGSVFFNDNGTITFGPHEIDQEIHRAVTFTPTGSIDLHDWSDTNVHIVYLHDLHDLEACGEKLANGIPAAIASMKLPQEPGDAEQISTLERNGFSADQLWMHNEIGGLQHQDESPTKQVRAIHINSTAKTITDVLVREDQAVEDAIAMIGEGCTEVDAARVFSWGIIIRDANQDPRRKAGYFALRGQMGYHVGSAVIIATNDGKARDIGTRPEDIMELVEWVDRKLTPWDEDHDTEERVKLALLYHENSSALAEFLARENPSRSDPFCHGTAAYLSNGAIVLGPMEWDDDVFMVTHFGSSMENYENLTIHTVYLEDFSDIARCVRELHDASTAALDRLFAGVEA